MARCSVKKAWTASKHTKATTMFCSSTLSINITVVAHSPFHKSDSSPEQSNAPKPPSPLTKKSITLPRNKIRHRPPQPSVIQIERIVGAGSFRDGEPGDSNMRKSVFDMFLGRTFEGPVEKKIREIGEWLLTNTETKFQSSGKGILLFVFQWLLPIWALSLLVACGAIKLPFSSPFLDDLIM